jgi:hypothetical protein
MGADNQAERVIARIEYREALAKIFHEAYWARASNISYVWEELPAIDRAAIIAGVTAVIERINQDMEKAPPGQGGAKS